MRSGLLYDAAMTTGVLTLLFFAEGLLFVGLGLPLAMRRIPPNRWYGFRVRKTLADEGIWYDANEVTGRDLVISGAVMSLAAVTIHLGCASLLRMDQIALLNVGVMAAALGATLIHGFWELAKLGD